MNSTEVTPLDPSVGTLARVDLGGSLKPQYVLCVAGGAAAAYWLPGWWKLAGVPLAWWGLAGLGLLPRFDVTPVINVINCAAPSLKALGELL